MYPCCTEQVSQEAILLTEQPGRFHHIFQVMLNNNDGLLKLNYSIMSCPCQDYKKMSYMKDHREIETLHLVCTCPHSKYPFHLYSRLVLLRKVMRTTLTLYMLDLHLL